MRPTEIVGRDTERVAQRQVDLQARSGRAVLVELDRFLTSSDPGGQRGAGQAEALSVPAQPLRGEPPRLRHSSTCLAVRDVRHRLGATAVSAPAARAWRPTRGPDLMLERRRRSPRQVAARRGDQALDAAPRRTFHSRAPKTPIPGEVRATTGYQTDHPFDRAECDSCCKWAKGSLVRLASGYPPSGLVELGLPQDHPGWGICQVPQRAVEHVGVVAGVPQQIVTGSAQQPSNA